MLNESIKYLSTEQIAQYCNVGKIQVERWIARGLMGANLKKKNVLLDDFIMFLNYRKIQPVESLENEGLKVLVIEDEVDVANTIGDIFGENGFRVMKSKNAIEAGCLIQYETPQVVTIDLNMDLYDGWDVLKIIQRLKLENRVWVIVISASSEDVLNEAVHFGADCYLQKPFVQKDLEKLINKFSLSPLKRIA